MAAVAQTHNKELMAKARESLSGNWGLGVGAYLLYLVIMCGVELVPILGSLASIAIYGAMIIGFNSLFISLARQQEANVGQLFSGFEKFWAGLGAYILQTIFIFLWMLLLIIPGIIAAYSYAMTFFILADNKDVGPLEAIKRSKEMMRGNKWKLFCLTCRFIGWIILCILTLGIGFLWVGPYMAVSFAKFYDDIKGADIYQGDVALQAG